MIFRYRLCDFYPCAAVPEQDSVFIQFMENREVKLNARMIGQSLKDLPLAENFYIDACDKRKATGQFTRKAARVDTLDGCLLIAQIQERKLHFKCYEYAITSQINDSTGNRDDRC